MCERKKVLEEFDLQKDFIQETVLPNIEKYRKGDCVVTVCDAGGKPMPHRKVLVKQTAHAFRFGANLFCNGCCCNLMVTCNHDWFDACTFCICNCILRFNTWRIDHGN